MSRIIFFGTPQIAAETLAILHQYHEIALVVTREDQKKNRGQKVFPSEVAILAQKLNIPTLKPDNLNDEAIKKTLSNLNSDFFVVISYGKILPKKILELPKECALNIHYSLLPRWRGASPIQSALLHGDQETGISIIKMIERLDAGNILIKKQLSIEKDDNQKTLTDKLALLGNAALLEVIKSFAQLKEEEQDENHVCYAKKFSKEDTKIDWHNSAQKIYQQFQAYSPSPNIFTFFRNKRVKILDCSVAQLEQYQSNAQLAGQIASLENQCLFVQTGCGLIKINALQPEGKKQIAAKDFINGYQIKIAQSGFE